MERRYQQISGFKNLSDNRKSKVRMETIAGNLCPVRAQGVCESRLRIFSVFDGNSLDNHWTALYDSARIIEPSWILYKGKKIVRILKKVT